jgi:hypothetical protein
MATTNGSRLERILCTEVMRQSPCEGMDPGDRAAEHSRSFRQNLLLPPKTAE